MIWGGWNCFYWGEHGRPAVVRLVFCPRRQPKPDASTRHPPASWVSGTCKAQSEDGGRGGAARARAMEQERAAPAGSLVGMGCPSRVPGPLGGWGSLGEAGRQHPGKGCPTGLGGRWAHSGRKPTGPRRTWLARLRAGRWRAFHQEGLSPTPGLGPWGLGCKGGRRRHFLGSWGWKAEARGLGSGCLVRAGWVCSGTSPSRGEGAPWAAEERRVTRTHCRPRGARGSDLDT